MSSHDVRFGGSGIPQTVLPAEAEAVDRAVQDARAAQGDTRREALAEAASEAPLSLLEWAELGDAGRDTIESYAYFRIGYHRGLDALRQNGWRGSGYVKWEHSSNQPFLRCLDGLQRRAAEIGETDEAERCALFLLQLEPSWPPES
jgi:hypothetical protein